MYREVGTDTGEAFEEDTSDKISGEGDWLSPL